MKRFKNQNGAITIITLVTILFMVSFLISAYAIAANKAKTQKEIVAETKETYESKQTMEEIYNSYFGNHTDILPSGYTEVEYLESTGNQYIDTGIIGKTGVAIEAKFQVLDLTRTRTIGVTDGTNRLSLVLPNAGTGYLVNQIGTTNKFIDTHSLSVGDIATTKQDSGKLYLNGTLIDTITPNTFNTNMTLYIFAQHAKKMVSWDASRVYNVKIWDNGTLVRNFIPCLNDTGVPCMYDTVSEKAFYNQGSGENFIAGTVVQKSKTEGIVPIYNTEQLLAIGTGKKITIDGKIYTFSNIATYLLKNDIEFDSEEQELEEDWIPIDKNIKFKGNFDWNGHKVIVTKLNDTKVTYNGLYRIPRQYTEVEYLESTGTQYIDTGVYGSNKVRFQVDFSVTDVNKFAQNGKNNTYSGNNRVNLGKANSGAWYWGFGNENITKDTADTKRHTMGIDIPNLQYWIDNTVYTKTSYTHNNNNPILIYLFAVNSQSSIQNYSYEKLYSSQIYESGVLVRNFIPCYRLSDEKPGMYDIVNDEFYINQGTGDDFVVGPDV